MFSAFAKAPNVTRLRMSSDDDASLTVTVISNEPDNIAMDGTPWFGSRGILIG